MTLHRFNKGDTSDSQYNKYHDTVYLYFKESFHYIKFKFPIKDGTICDFV